MSNPNLITTTATAIADQLGETVGGARATIWRTVRTLGPERAQVFVAQALEVEANGEMMVPDGSRTCTLGGVFFYLVRTQISDEEALAINVLWRGAARRTAQDFAHQMRALVDEQFPQAVVIQVVLDNLNTHTSSLVSGVSTRRNRIPSRR